MFWCKRNVDLPICMIKQGDTISIADTILGEIVVERAVVENVQHIFDLFGGDEAILRLSVDNVEIHDKLWINEIQHRVLLYRRRPWKVKR